MDNKQKKVANKKKDLDHNYEDVVTRNCEPDRISKKGVPAPGKQKFIWWRYRNLDQIFLLSVNANPKFKGQIKDKRESRQN